MALRSQRIHAVDDVNELRGEPPVESPITNGKRKTQIEIRPDRSHDDRIGSAVRGRARARAAGRTARRPTAGTGDPTEDDRIRRLSAVSLICRACVTFCCGSRSGLVWLHGSRAHDGASLPLYGVPRHAERGNVRVAGGHAAGRHDPPGPAPGSCGAVRARRSTKIEVRPAHQVRRASPCDTFMRTSDIYADV